MADNFQAFKVASLEQSSASKFNNLVQAIEDAVNSLDNSNVADAAAILVSKLAAGSNGQVLTTAGSSVVWAGSAGAPGYSTSLPGSPADAQEHILVDSTSAPTYAWRLRFNSALAKWEFIGGRSKVSEVATSENTSSTTYAALATAGPSIVIPVAGDYIVETGAMVLAASTNITGLMSYDIGGTGAVDADSISARQVASDPGVSVSRMKVKTGLTAVTLTAKYRMSTAGNANFAHRWMRVTPVTL